MNHSISPELGLTKSQKYFLFKKSAFLSHILKYSLIQLNLT
jgi:hypothetical protein